MEQRQDTFRVATHSGLHLRARPPVLRQIEDNLGSPFGFFGYNHSTANERQWTRMKEFLHPGLGFAFIGVYSRLVNTMRSHSNLARLKLRMTPTLWPVILK
jgi:hypothetical protein